MPQLTPVTVCPQTAGPIRVAHYSYDALGSLVCVEQHGKGFLIVNWGISLIVDSSLSTYAPFLGTYVERSFVTQGTPSLASPPALCGTLACLSRTVASTYEILGVAERWQPKEVA